MNKRACVVLDQGIKLIMHCRFLVQVTKGLLHIFRFWVSEQQSGLKSRLWETWIGSGLHGVKVTGMLLTGMAKGGIESTIYVEDSEWEDLKEEEFMDWDTTESASGTELEEIGVDSDTARDLLTAFCSVTEADDVGNCWVLDKTNEEYIGWGKMWDF